MCNFKSTTALNRSKMSVNELRCIRKTQKMSTGIIAGEHTEQNSISTNHFNHSLKAEFTQKCPRVIKNLHAANFGLSNDSLTFKTTMTLIA